MITSILIALAALLLLLFIVVSLRPADFRITRSAVIAAPPAVVFANVNDFHKWEAWSPWAKMDPDSKMEYAGAPAGEGSVYSWSGNSKVGEGRMTLLESQPNEFIKLKLEFFKPFQATHTVEFTFSPVGMQTDVSWSMYGKNNFAAKAVTLVMNCDKMIGGQYEQGLASLNEVSRAATPQTA
ncbi:MAG TPA: SRPBCC family protein [Chthoniobacteraceae bacterium]|nr:SRPBCC family protein [Chthoniobacteraceae bacterium]